MGRGRVEIAARGGKRESWLLPQRERGKGSESSSHTHLKLMKGGERERGGGRVARFYAAGKEKERTDTWPRF